MNGLPRVTHSFVGTIPKSLEDGTIYISMEYATAIHKCCCGCGREVVTPLTPTDWALIFDGETVSLYPSIGNWSFPCQSHYWIQRDQVKWARKWTKAEIASGRAADQWGKERYYDTGELTGKSDKLTVPQGKEARRSKFWKWWRRS